MTHEDRSDKLMEAFDIVIDVKQSLEDDSGDIRRGFTRLWNKLDNILGEIEDAANKLAAKQEESA